MKKIAKLLNVRKSILLIMALAIASTFLPSLNAIFMGSMYVVWVIMFYRKDILKE